jgi:bacterioferritin-associated ferredoxin
VQEVRNHTGAGDGCTACHSRLREFLTVHGYASSPALPDICSVK